MNSFFKHTKTAVFATAVLDCKEKLKSVFDGASPRQKHLPLAPTKEAGAEERSRRDKREFSNESPAKRVSFEACRLSRHAKTAVFMTAVLMVLVFSGCGKSTSAEVSKSAVKMDTVVTITIYSGGGAEDIDAAFAEIDRISALVDVNTPGSETERLSQLAGKEWLEVSDETAELLALAKKYYELSGGLFDVTAQPLVKLWNINDGGYYPSDEERRAAVSLVGGDGLMLDGNRAFLAREGMSVTLGAIAKGYIADKVKETLIERGVTSAVVNLGGNVLIIGAKPDGSPFRVGIQNPLGQSGNVIRYIDAADEALVSSGVYERYFMHEGKRYHHILDPFTGMPAETGVSGVTIIGKSSADADALSTVCLLMGQEKGLELIESLPGVEAVFVSDDGTVTASGGAKDRIYR